MESSDRVYLSATEALALFRERQLSSVDFLEALIVGRPFDDITVFRIGAALGHTRSWLDWGRRQPALG